MEEKRLRRLSLVVFKTRNNMNPGYMKVIFHKTSFSMHRTLNIEVKENYTTKENKSLRCRGPHIWNCRPSQSKKETDCTKFKEIINDWLGMKCKWNLHSF